jgi:hypothetical protein
MPVAMMKIQRFPQTDREALARAAFEWCQAVKAIDGVRARFYWNGPNGLAFFLEAPTVAALDLALGSSDDHPPAAVSRAAFAMADAGDVSQAERWIEPSRGEAAYRNAGR